MKTNVRFSIFTLLCLALVFTGCKKDETAPVITLKGNSVETVDLQGSYVDAGATALDDEDGDLTNAIIVNNPVNTNTLGEYIVSYNVSDEAGNAAMPVTRMVNVMMSSGNFVGNFTGTSDCNTTLYPIASDLEVAAGSNPNRIILRSFYNLVTNPEDVEAIFDELEITIPDQNVGPFGGITLSGEGTISEDLSTITLNLNFNSLIADDECTAVYTRQ